jgi:tricarballylate dehydrogenase
VGVTPPKSNYTLTIDAPPFEGFAIRCGMTFTFGGLKIDPATGQVQHVAGRPIKGLYAAGEMVGGLWVGNYASGSGMMAGATFGRIAGRHAASLARQS